MWPQTYEPLSNSLWLSALVAALPVFVLLVLLGLMRKPAWIASLAGLAAAAIVARAEYHMPWSMIVSSSTYGAAYRIAAHRLDRVHRDSALPPDARDRQIRDYQGFDRQPHRRSAFAGAC